MELSSAALWLNTIYAGYDSLLLGFMHKLAESFLGVVLTPLMKLITLLGEKGLIFFLLALVLMCFSRTRPLGVCLFGAVCCGALITNVILKDTVARPRPFEAEEQFRQWWVTVGSPKEDGFSFPSGHVTAAAAGMTALSLMRGKKLVLPSVIIVLLMGMSRNYLMAHYPSDVLAAALIGLFSGFAAWLITRLIFKFLEDRRDIPVIELILDFDLPLPDMGGLLGRFKRDSGARGGGAARYPDRDDAARYPKRDGGTRYPDRDGGARYSDRDGGARGGSAARYTEREGRADSFGSRSSSGYRPKHMK